MVPSLPDLALAPAYASLSAAVPPCSIFDGDDPALACNYLQVGIQQNNGKKHLTAAFLIAGLSNITYICLRSKHQPMTQIFAYMEMAQSAMRMFF